MPLRTTISNANDIHYLGLEPPRRETKHISKDLVFQLRIRTALHLLPNMSSGFGGLDAACWHLVPKFAVSNLAEAVGFLRVNKNPQHVGRHGCLSVVIVVCCQVEVSATN